MRHRGEDRQAKEQKQRRECDAHEERGEVAEVTQEHAQAEARDKAHALRQLQTTLGIGLATCLVAEELQGRLPYLSEKAHEGDEDERDGGDHGALDEDLPAPPDVEGRQAVGAVVEVAHGLGEDGHAERTAQKRGEDAYHGGECQVVQHDLALAITAGEERPDDGALLLDGGVGEDHEDEGHDHDDDVEERRPHHGVAVYVVARIADALVGIRVDEVIHACVCVREGVDHVLLGIGAVCDGEVAIVEGEGVRVGWRAAGVFGGVFGCLELRARRLEGGRHAAVLDGVFVAHAFDDAPDGVRGEQKARREGNRAAHEEEDAEVLADVVAQLAGEPPCQGSHRAPTNRARRRTRGRH